MFLRSKYRTSGGGPGCLGQRIAISVRKKQSYVMISHGGLHLFLQRNGKLMIQSPFRWIVSILSPTIPWKLLSNFLHFGMHLADTSCQRRIFYSEIYSVYLQATTSQKRQNVGPNGPLQVEHFLGKKVLKSTRRLFGVSGYNHDDSLILCHEQRKQYPSDMNHDILIGSWRDPLSKSPKLGSLILDCTANIKGNMCVHPSNFFPKYFPILPK